MKPAQKLAPSCSILKSNDFSKMYAAGPSTLTAEKEESIAAPNMKRKSLLESLDNDDVEFEKIVSV